MAHDMKLTMPECARRFNWWWRGLFVPEKDLAMAVARNLGLETLFRNPVCVPKGVDVGSAFRRIFKDRERSAYLYELEKRLLGGYRFERPWLDLDEEHRKALERLWPDPIQFTRAHLQPGAAAPGPNWTKPVCNSWNLKMNDNTLAQEFLRGIHEERRRRGIPNPKANAGIRRRPRSWRPIELLDILQNKVGKLNDSESSQVSKARKEYAMAMTVYYSKSD